MHFDYFITRWVNFMDTITLKVKTRDITGKKMRAQADKKIPAVVYGPDAESRMLWVEAVDFKRAFSEVGTNVVLSLIIDDKDAVNVLVHDYQTDALTDDFTHIDFYLVNMNEAVETEIPLVFTGVSNAVKNLGGTLVKNQDAIMVRALPADLPHEIEVDLAKLETFDDHITIEDIVVGDKVEIISEEGAMVAMVAAPRTEEEMAALDEEVDADVSKVEGVIDEDEENVDSEGQETKTAEEVEEK
jgi:large subunit ribosomal protein L25